MGNGDQTETTQHMIHLQVEENCKICYPVTYYYAKGVLIQYKPWSKDKPLTKLLKSETKAIRTLKRMMDKRHFQHV